MANRVLRGGGESVMPDHSHQVGESSTSCALDGCAGHVVTPDAEADRRAYDAKPNLGMNAWKRDIEESDKGFFVTMPKRERGGPPP